MLGAEQFKETSLDILEEERWTVPTLLTKMRIIYCEEKQDACLQAIRDRQAVNRMWMDQIGVWSYEASGVKPPTLDGRFNWPQPRLS
jgi:hypothetical protein